MYGKKEGRWAGMSKTYHYKGKAYCEGMDTGNRPCEGNLLDLYLRLKDEGEVDEETVKAIVGEEEEEDDD